MKTIAAVATGWLLLTLLHTLAMVGVAHALAGLAAWNVAEQLVMAAPGDDLHSRLALGMVGNAKVLGIALRPPWADSFVTASPSPFGLSHLLPEGTWAGPVYAAGSSAVAVHVAETLVNLILVFLGVAATLLGAGSPVSALRNVGLLAVVYGVAGQLQLSWTDDGGGQMVLSMVATKVLPIDSERYDGLVQLNWPGSFAINAVIVFVSAVSGLCVILLYRRARMLTHRVSSPGLTLLPRHHIPALTALVLAGVLAFQTPFKHGVAFEPAPESPLRDAVVARAAAVLPRSPSVVTVTQTPTGFEYRVNGRRQFIRGFGYNAATLDEPPAERAQRLTRDFAAIGTYGANTIVGWDQNEFDEVLLEKAAQAGLGVILPFELQSSWDYDAPLVRGRLLNGVSLWVERHKNSPALRMWGLGNEVVHGIAEPESPRARAFAHFLVEAADRIHQLDPNHPVVYRDAEDQYLAPVARTLTKDETPRPWFVYGMNFFTPRLEQALETESIVRLPHALLISEFAPVGLRGPDRPGGYRRIWEIIRNHGHRVLGGCAYVWSTAGREPLDWAFGLTNDDGNPADNAIYTLAALFLDERSRE